MLIELIKNAEAFVNGKIKLIDLCTSFVNTTKISEFCLFKFDNDSLNLVYNWSNPNPHAKICLKNFPHFLKKVKEKKDFSSRSMLLKEKEELKNLYNFFPTNIISLYNKIPYLYNLKSNKPLDKSALFIFESALLQHFSLNNDLSSINKQYNELKNEFITKVSHEIRTPLNGIIGNTYLLKNQSLDFNSFKIVENIENSANELLKQLNCVLTFNSVKEGKIINEDNEIILAELIENCCQLFLDKAQEKNIHFTYEIKSKDSIVFINDKNKISQVLISLLDNAFKFTKKGFIKIEAEPINNSLVFRIQDSGVGIQESAQKYIFNEFRQGDNSSTREHRGLGLGLSLCKQIINSLEGEILFSSEENKGSEFYFKIPIIKKTDYEHSEKTYSGSILLVEDDVMNQEITKRILNKMGFEVTVADNGAIALELCKKQNFEVIFMDCQMPIMDGYTASKEIKKIKPTQKIFAFTAHAFEEDRQKCLNSGMDDFLTKPINVSQFHHCIQKHLDHIVNNFNSDPLEQFLEPSLSKDLESLSFVKKLITDFSISGTNDLNLLQKEFNSNNIENMRKISHKLKSTFASFGMVKTKNLLSEYQKKDKFTQKDINLLQDHFNFTIFSVHKWLTAKGA